MIRPHLSNLTRAVPDLSVNGRVEGLCYEVDVDDSIDADRVLVIEALPTMYQLCASDSQRIEPTVVTM